MRAHACACDRVWNGICQHCDRMNQALILALRELKDEFESCDATSPDEKTLDDKLDGVTSPFKKHERYFLQ